MHQNMKKGYDVCLSLKLVEVVYKKLRIIFTQCGKMRFLLSLEKYFVSTA